jgi:hypothetical protein
MATMQASDDIAQPIDELRNLKVNDKFPLLFLDEFDSDPKNYPSLLPLLWDGELQVGHRDLKLGKAVIVLAGSSPELPKIMQLSGTMSLVNETQRDLANAGKLIDLLSRINGGVIEIPDLDLRTQNRDRRIDKVCIAVSLLTARFGRNSLNSVPRSLLRFVANVTFRYGVRSIAHLIETIDGKSLSDGDLKLQPSDFPMESQKTLEKSSLRLHLLDKDRGYGVVSKWHEVSKDQHMIEVINSISEIVPFYVYRQPL